ncbi:hypothetical protein FRB95_009436 [Tulasnella sp. JGI-2019a]|nr:hypothetical protein FRB95_009436 [Tulasnella sp. JGI-2019a]
MPPAVVPIQATMTTSPPTTRHKMPRSNTVQPGSVPPVVQQPRPRRTMSEDSSSPEIRVARAASTRTKSHGANGAARPAKEKPSLHADAIDTLDNTGLGVGMFHHDGPFDACAPSRNKSNKTHRAPMFAFGADPAQQSSSQNNTAGTHNIPVYDKRLSPLAAHTIAAMAQSDGPYPAGAISNERSSRANGVDSGMTMFGSKLGPSPRKMTLMEARGTAELEPFEEFSAGAGVAGGVSARSSLDQPMEGGFEAMYKKDARAAAARRGESLDVPRRVNRLPPPQPINLPGSRSPTTEIPPYANGAGGMPVAADGPQTPSANVGRSRSLMQRIRRMRDNPNVPLGGAMAAPETGGGYFSDASPARHGQSNYTSARTPGGRPLYTGSEQLQLGGQAAQVQQQQLRLQQQQQQQFQQQQPLQQGPRPSHHRSQTRGAVKEQPPLPSLPQQVPMIQQPRRHPTTVPEEQFVMVDRSAPMPPSKDKKDKALPPAPGTQSDTEGLSRSAQNGAPGVTRKISLYKRVKGVVAGGGGAGAKN